jgi:hypothetical protein
MLLKQAVSRILSVPDFRRERQSSLSIPTCVGTLATYPPLSEPIRYCTYKYEFSRFTLALRRALSKSPRILQSFLTKAFLFASRELLQTGVTRYLRLHELMRLHSINVFGLSSPTLAYAKSE